MKQLVIFGTGDIAQLAHYYFSKEGQYNVAAFAVDGNYLKESSFMDLPVVAFEDVEKNYPPDDHQMFIALSYSRVNKLRAEKYQIAKNRGYRLASYLSPHATIFDNVAIGDNCFIFEDNTVQPFVKIGNNVTLWSGNHIGHHSQIGDHCFIASHVVISGRVKVEPFCFIGVNATLRDNIVIGKECIIGAGATILKNTKEKEVYRAKGAELLPMTSDKLRGI